MHARVGAAGSCHRDVLALDGRQRGLELRLHRPRIGLPLKAGKVGAVVTESVTLKVRITGSRFQFRFGCQVPARFSVKPRSESMADLERGTENRNPEPYCGLDPGFTTGMP